MSDHVQLTNIAREAFKRLIENKLPPTPDNYREHYRRVYQELQGRPLPEPATSEAPVWMGTLLVRCLPQEHHGKIPELLKRRDWLAQIGSLMPDSPQLSSESPWRAPLIALLEICEEVVSAFERSQYPQPEARLQQALNNLISGLKSGSDKAVLCSLLIQLEGMQPRLKTALREQSRIQPALVNLLRLIVDNIQAISLGNEWLSRELDIVSETLDRPLNLGHIQRLHQQLQEVILKQRGVKNNLYFAQERMKDMLTSFMDQLLHFSQDTEVYQEKLQDCSRRISSVSNIEELSTLVHEVAQNTSLIHSHARTSHEQLEVLRSRAMQAEGEIARLQNELVRHNELIRLDPLTGILNRKGMEDALGEALPLCRERGQPLSCALIDIDDFKMLNDSHGHPAGDAALILLARLICEHVAEQDSVVRYGGEEFFILLPNCDLAHAEATVQRIRASLARRTLIYQRKPVPIAFSAGVAQMDLKSENPLRAIELADQALYQAKREGKGRVCRAALPMAA